MPWEVRWLPKALDELAAMWMRADAEQRRAINSAIADLDRTLEARPGILGESREADKRITFKAPVGMGFQVEASRRIVWVFHVWTYRTRGESQTWSGEPRVPLRAGCSHQP